MKLLCPAVMLGGVDLGQAWVCPFFVVVVWGEREILHSKSAENVIYFFGSR